MQNILANHLYHKKEIERFLCKKRKWRRRDKRRGIRKEREGGRPTSGRKGRGERRRVGRRTWDSGEEGGGNVAGTAKGNKGRREREGGRGRRRKSVQLT